MPLYDLRCSTCNAEKEVLVDYRRAITLELVCAACGGSMTRAPLRLRSKVYTKSASPEQRSAASMAGNGKRARPCGHSYQCRCAIKLTRANPFKREVGAALGKVTQD
jgi:hypothetical protein